jgi:endonuclease/exonuclease/phosphatase family metal-dependent hydrolase
VYNNHLQSIRLQKQNYAIFNKLNLREEKQLKEIKELSYQLRNAFIKRAEQVDVISRNIKESSYPVIVCGDFNDTPVSYTYHKMKGHLKDAYMESGAWAGNTYTGFFPSFRIDFIFYSSELESRAYNTHRVKFSDHYPVSCYIVFP